MIASNTIKMNARQFLMLGEDPPGTRLELVDGEIIVSPSPVPEHSNVIFQLGYILLNHIKERDLGELFGDVDTILDEYNVRRPDIIYFSHDRAHLVGDKAMEGPPDLAVEVVSPGSVVVDREQKFDEYRKAGVLNYWIVDPAKRSIDGFTLKGRRFVATGHAEGDQSIALPPFPDLKIKLSDLWRKRRRR